MWIHNLDPVLFSIGPVAIRWYGLVYVLGFLAAYFAMRKILKYTEKEADMLIGVLVLGVLVGARTFFFAFYRPDLFTPLEFISIWHGGMSFHGGLLGAGLAGWWWCKKKGKNPWELADLSMIVLAGTLVLGRLANFINAEIIGTRFDGAWCVDFSQSNPAADGCRHPVQLYAAAKNLVITTILVLLYQTKRFAHGFVFWMFVLLYAVLRFTVQLFRDDPVLLFGWMKMGHVLTVVMFIVAVAVLYWKHRSDVAKLFKFGNQVSIQ